MGSVEISCTTCWFDFTVLDEQEVKVTHCPNCGSRIILEEPRFAPLKSLLSSGPPLSGPARSPSGDVRQHT